MRWAASFHHDVLSHHRLRKNWALQPWTKTMS
jgi:hypothetical protein